MRCPPRAVRDEYLRDGAASRYPRAALGEITPERWERVERIFEEALEQASAERLLFVARACNGDDDLRRRVEQLIAGDGAAAGFLERPTLRSPDLSTVAAAS